MILKELLAHFDISVELPQYLYDESFNEVFLKGELFKESKHYRIVIETQKDVIHSLYICEASEYPVCVSSRLPNGRLNGIRFGQSSDDLKYI